MQTGRITIEELKDMEQEEPKSQLELLQEENEALIDEIINLKAENLMLKMEDQFMYELCKKQYTRKLERGSLSEDYINKHKKNLGTFLFFGEINNEQYEELMNLLQLSGSEQ